MTFAVAAEAYDRFMGRYSVPLAREFVRFARLDGVRRVLDVGCGPGALTGGLEDVEEGSVAVTVRHATFDEWWHPYTLGVGPAGAFVAGLDDERRERLRSLCAERLPRAPFDVDAGAWAARARL